MSDFGSILQRHKGVAPGFDFVRLALALGVVLWHSYALINGNAVAAQSRHGLVAVLTYALVPAFFALSGFLVAGSMLRLRNLKTFLAFRALRILPALCVEITLSALVLGPLVTTLPLGQYYSNPEFFEYFTNIVGWIRFHLPSVFVDNPISSVVNGQLWTIPPEMHCYALLAVLIILRIGDMRRLMLTMFIIALVVYCVRMTVLHVAFGVGTSRMVVLFFCCGAIFYLWRDRIPANPWLAIASAVCFAAGILFPSTLNVFLLTPSITYLTVYAGLHTMPKMPVLMSGDYSYGIYLYAFPIQQAVIWALPGMKLWYLHFIVAGTITILLAMVSWHVVEKPALRLRHRLAPRAAVPKPTFDDTSAAPASEPVGSRL